ncbi:CPCC family cysteine-rich protein [Aureisphaera galaxeae]|uniref:CPCC family cysteine-rich protein n=1 Tax=Aureisphaera galaxeae TaxID=1538023 RepID=UPI002350A848|nr:CPCC family cysteine-rich protein [Aureisphaera galaxeae]MDC8003872.1 CPCC family cysteine-rich protein [Aureisphaera galaxeae]
MRERKTFDTSKLSKEDLRLLESFHNRRRRINSFISKNDLKLTTCPGCGFPTFTEDWFHEICGVCNWQNDGQDDPHADEVWGGPNYKLSLTENRLNICRTLEEKSKALNGVAMQDPNEIMDVLKAHQKRMDSFDDDKMMNALRDDPIWEEWTKARKEVLNDLIKR